MDALTKALLLSWDLRIEVIVPLLVLGAIQVIGWRKLRQLGRTRFANGWRLASYLGGLLVVAVALLSPVDVLSGQLFLMHMIQHLLLMMLAAPLLLLANPFPVFLWALPRDLRIRVGSWFQRRSALYPVLAWMTQPGLIWIVFVSVYVGWHDPNMYNLALRSDFVHDLEHITFFGAAMLFWWKVIGAGPQIGRRLSVPMRAAFAISAIPPNMLTGVALAFASTPIYSHYTQIPRLYGISVMDDQTWAGLIMWIPGSMMYIVAAIVLVGSLLGKDDKPIRSVEEWSTEEKMIAPGLEHRRHRAMWRRLHKFGVKEANSQP